MAFDCCNCLAKYILCIFNFVFFLAGGAVLTVGVWLNLDKKSFLAFTKIIEEQTHVQEFQQFTQPNVFSQLAYFLIAVGAIVFFVSFMGYCGALRESRCLLAFYGILLILILVLEVTAAGFAIANKAKAEEETHKFLESTIKQYYSPYPNETDAISAMWNILMAQMSCCGIDSYEDFKQSARFNASGMEIPPACCVLEGNIQNLKPKFSNCVTNPSSVNSYFKTGCYETVVNWILEHINIAIWVIIGVILVELFVTFLSFCLCKGLDVYEK
uniref:Tetraspanin n=1 Tax=Clastoptera arizonana TaxID=38151 RepID=A0A1B6CBJ2_9HEMI